MTAIALLWCLDGRDSREPMERMLGALKPHGNQDQALWSDGPVSLGRALYRTTPEDRFDRQPLSMCGGTTVLVADIRIDNRNELASDLGLPANDAQRMADSEILGHAWERWGEECVHHLLGDFAFVVWDRRRQQIFCARDALGQRPLFYHRGRNVFAVASMPKGLLALPDVPRRLDEDMVGASLMSLPVAGSDNPFAGRSFYKEIERIPPASVLTLSAGKSAQVRSYWYPEKVQPIRLARDSDYVEQAGRLLEASVSARLRAVGTVGSHLSAGLDSSTVTVTAARLLQPRSERLIAFTAVPRPGEAVTIKSGLIADEGPGAADVARPFANIEHILVQYPLVSPLEPVERCLFAFDEPMRNPCNLAWMDEIGRRAAERHVAVMLHAPMGNATLGFEGHERFHELFAQGRFLRWFDELVRYSRSGPQPWRRARLQLSNTMPGRLQRVVQRAAGLWWARPEAVSALSGDIYDKLDERRNAGLRQWSDARLDRGNRLRRLVFADPGTFVAGTIARHGFELRDPMADRRLVEFCLAIPLDQFYRGGEDRHLVRRLMRGVLPPEVLHGCRKGLQGVGWLRNLQFGREAVLAELVSMRHSPARSRLLDLNMLEKLANSIPSGAPSSVADVADYRHKLLRSVAMARFIRYVEGGNR